MTAALAERHPAAAPSEVRGASPRPSSAVSRTVAERRLRAVPEAGPPVEPAVGGPRLAPVPECEPPLDVEPWEHVVARAPFGTRLPWPDPPTRPVMDVALTTATPTAATPVSAAPCPVPPPMTHRRWPYIRTLTPPGAGSAVQARGSVRPQPRGTRPVYTASGAPPQPEDEYADLRPVDIMPRATEPAVTRPPALDAATLLSRAVVEVLAGRRPAAQLRPHCIDGVYQALDDFPRLGPGPSLVSVWVCEPSDDRVEVSASFRCGGMTRALAMRLDSNDHRWQVTALQLS